MIAILSLSLALTLPTQSGTAPSADAPRLAYPASRRVAAFDEKHGTRVDDPYRWLEAMESPEVLAWAHRQDAFTTDAVAAMGGRAAILRQLESVAEYRNLGTPTIRGGRAFFTRRDVGQGTAVLYVEELR